MAKYVAGREKDLVFNREMAVHAFIHRKRLEALVDELPVDMPIRQSVCARITHTFDEAPPPVERPPR